MGRKDVACQRLQSGLKPLPFTLCAKRGAQVTARRTVIAVDPGLQPFDAAEIGAQARRERIGCVLDFSAGIAVAGGADVKQGQGGRRVLQHGAGLSCVSVLVAHPCGDGPSDVVKGLRTRSLRRGRECVIKAGVNRIRDHDTAFGCEVFQPRGDVDAVAIEILFVAYDTAVMDTDAQTDPSMIPEATLHV